MSNFELDFSNTKDIIVLGVGEAGNKGIELIDNQSFSSVDFIYVDTDKKSLEKYFTKKTLLLENHHQDVELGDPLIGKLAASDSIEKIKDIIKDVKVLILASGLGGATSSGVLPVIAKIAKDMDIISVAVVTLPFSHEGEYKEHIARNSLIELEKFADVVIPISNNRLLNNYPDIIASDAFRLVNNILKNTLKTFIEVLEKDGIINISIKELNSFLKDKGSTYVGFGYGLGRNKINRAINGVLNSKIIEKSIKNASNVILNIVADQSVTMKQINEIVEILKNKIKNPALNVISSFNVNKNFINEIQISLIATFNNQEKNSFTNSLHNSQELLLQIGNTLENELSNYTTGELDLSSFDIEQNYFEENKDQDEFIISNETSDEDDDIPFFLK